MRTSDKLAAVAATITSRMKKVHKSVFSPAPTASHAADINGAHACATNTGRVFITDRLSKWQILVDTGFTPLRVPSKLIP
jgi:hypothetical protein